MYIKMAYFCPNALFQHQHLKQILLFDYFTTTSPCWNTVLTLNEEPRFDFSFMPKYCAEACKDSFSFGVSFGGATGIFLRLRWAPQQSGSFWKYKTTTSPLWLQHKARKNLCLYKVKTSQVSELTLAAGLVSGVCVGASWWLLLLFSLACLKDRYSL